MAVVIRLARYGRKNVPFYRISVADSRNTSTGRFLQQIGTYDPKLTPPAVKIDESSALKWLGAGAKPSDAVRSLFHHQGLMEKFENIRKNTATSETELKARPFETKKPKQSKKVIAKEAKAAEATAGTAA